MRKIFVSMAVLLVTLACGCTETDTRVATRKLSDAEITAAVKAKLATDEGLRTLTDVHVSTRSGVVTLVGNVPATYESTKAEQLAASVDGVAKVNNELRVEAASAPEKTESRARRKPERKPTY